MYYDILQRFRDEIDARKIDEVDIERAIQPVRDHLNSYFYDSQLDNHKVKIIGAFHRGTAISGLGAIDIIYMLPDNLRSHLLKHDVDSLQWMETLLTRIFSPMQWSIALDAKSSAFVIYDAKPWPIKIWPVFFVNDENFILLQNASQSRSTQFQPYIADAKFQTVNLSSNRNLEILAKTVRYWVAQSGVSMSGFLVDCLAMNFISNSPYRRLSRAYQDCLLRDFFYYLSCCEPSQESWQIEGTQVHVYRDGPFERQARRAYLLTERMIANSLIRQDYEAKHALQGIIGDVIMQSR